jgi:hypothetical protein
MQELLGRLGALDPEAGQGLRVIACFDELMQGGVNVRGLLAAAAALTGTTVGADVDGGVLRIDPRGDDVRGPVPEVRQTAVGEPATWIERSLDDAHANDVMVLERLSLAVRLRLNPQADEHGQDPGRRDLAVCMNKDLSAGQRREAALRIGLVPTDRYRVLAAPLFATWERHPRGPEDVVPTEYGPVHLSIIHDGAQAEGSPLGLGIGADLDQLPLSAATAIIALRLHVPGTAKNLPVDAEAMGGLAEMLAELELFGGSDRDGAPMERIMAHSWGRASVDALVESASVREAARLAGVHHSTMAARLEEITKQLGFDPLSGLGRTRLGMAYLRWRLRNSTVLTLPPPHTD